jgi:LPS sulfotransferase NodH
LSVSPARPEYHPERPVPVVRQALTYAKLLRRPNPPVRGAARPVSFLVFAQGRTGSSLLVDLLRSHPDVRCDDEILRRRVRFPNAWVDAHRRAHRGWHYGFKVKIYQLTRDQGLDPSAWLRAMHEQGWKLIHLRRRNSLRHALSNVVAQEMGRFVFRGEEKPKVPTVTVDVPMLLGTIRVREEQAELERAALDGLPHVEVCYEEDLRCAQGHQRTLDRLSDSLGLPRARAKTAVRRITEDDLKRIVANYDEVVAALESTPWVKYLDE